MKLNLNVILNTGIAFAVGVAITELVVKPALAKVQ